jgi:hypothetical protein
MSQIKSLAIALLTAVSIVPAAQAFPIDVNAVSIEQPAENLHAQLVINIGGGPAPRPHRAVPPRRPAPAPQAPGRPHWSSHNRSERFDRSDRARGGRDSEFSGHREGHRSEARPEGHRAEARPEGRQSQGGQPQGSQQQGDRQQGSQQQGGQQQGSQQQGGQQQGGQQQGQMQGQIQAR